MTKPYSEAFKRKMVQRLIGKDAVSAHELAQETGVRQQNLSRWLAEARSLPLLAASTVRTDDLDRDIAIQLRIARAIDDTHAAGADDVADLLATEPAAGR